MNMRIGVVLALTLLLAFCQVARASEPTVVSLNWSKESVRLSPVSGDQTTVTMAGAVSFADPGAPDLPWVPVRVSVPAGSRVSTWSWHPAASQPIGPPLTPAPARLDRPSEAGGPLDQDPDPAIYSGSTPYPGEAALFRGAQSGAGHIVATFLVCPFRWDPGTRGLSFASGGILQVSFSTDPLPDRFLPPPLRRSGDLPASGGLPAEQPALAPRLLYALRGGLAPTARPSLDAAPVQFLIVTDTTLVSAWTPLVDWKNRLGYPAAVRTMQWVESNYPQGVDQAEKLRLFIRDAYLYWGTTTVLLGGDPSLVPIRYARSFAWEPCQGGHEIATDYYYACLDGNWNDNGNSVWGESKFSMSDSVGGCSFRVVSDKVDLRHDIRVGRVSARSPEEVAIWISKYMRYATDPDRTTAYLDTLLTLGEVLFDPTWIRGDCESCNTCPGQPCVREDGATYCFNVIDLLFQSTAGRAFVADQLYERYEYWNNVRHPIPAARLLNLTDVVASLNAGRNVVFHMGHGDRDRWAIGDSRLLVSDVLRLQSEPRFSGLAYVVNCNSAAVQADCVGSAWQVAPHGGGINYIGSTDLDFPSTAGQMQNDFFELWSDSYDVDPGDAYYEVADAAADLVADSEYGAYRWQLYSVIFLGDPDLTVWKEIPRLLQVTTSTTPVYPGTNQVTVTVSYAGGGAVSGARVCLYKPNDTMSVGTTGANGVCILPFSPTSAGSYKVTVSYPRAVPFQDDTKSVQLPQSASFVTVADYTLADSSDSGAGTIGNGNGRMEIGETVGLNLRLENHGTADANNVIVRLHTTGQVPGVRVAIPDSVGVPVGQIVRGGNVQVPLAFHIRLDYPLSDTSAAPPKRIDLPLLVHLESNDTQQNHDQRIVPIVYRPGLTLVGTRLWTGDGSLPPDSVANGKDMLLTLELYNHGGGTASRLRAHVRAASPGSATITDSLLAFPDITADSLGVSDTCRFHVNQAFNLQFVLELEDSLSSAPHTLWTRTVRLDRRPARPESLQAAGTPSSITLSWTEAEGQHIWGYRVYRSDTAAGSFEMVRGGLVSKVRTFADEGLPGLARFYYQVAAVDSSGRMSRPTAVLDASSAPAMAPGWPNYITQSRDASPTIEHPRNGLLMNAIILSSDVLYVFKGDGTEYLDGDRNASTRGPFMSAVNGLSFWGKPTVYDVDGDGEKEIVALVGGEAPLSASLMVFDRNGVLKWQQQLHSSPHAVSTPAIGHIDANDHRKVQIVFIQNASLIAFNGDGTPFRTNATDGHLFEIPGTTYQVNSVALADLDGGADQVAGEPTDEIIFTTRPGDVGNTRLYVLRGRDASGAYATNFPGFPYQYSLTPGLPSTPAQISSSSAAVGDVNGDGLPDIVISTYNQLWLFDPAAASPLVWHKTLVPYANVNATINSSPALGDVDGDGHLDIVVGGGSGTLYVLDGGGNPLPGFKIDDNHPYLQVASATARMGSPILADLDGSRDGPAGHETLPEVAIGSDEGKVYVLRHDGTQLRGFPYTVSGGKIGAGLSAWDVDKDGTQNLVIQADKVQTLTVLELPDSHFDPSDSLANPWPQFRHDARGTGYILTPPVYNPAETVTLLSESSGPLSVDLRWRTTLDWRSFQIERRLEPDGDWESLGEWRPDQIEEVPGSFHAVDQVPAPGIYGYRLGARDASGRVEWIGEATVSLGGAPVSFQLHPAHPNPFRPSTTVRLDLPAAGPCDVRVVDAAGRTVRVLLDAPAGPGPVTLIWNGRDDAGRETGSGIYFIKAEAGGQGRGTEKIVRVR